MADSNPATAQELAHLVEKTMENLHCKFKAMSEQITSRMNEMGSRIEDLERNVSELMSQAGVDEPLVDLKKSK
ncbi:HSBP1 protein, partial [Polypterus senegalus]